MLTAQTKLSRKFAGGIKGVYLQEQLARERTVSGRVQIQVWYHDERKELVVAVLAADDLAPRDDSLGFGSLPEAYARLCLLPLT